MLREQKHIPLERAGVEPPCGPTNHAAAFCDPGNYCMNRSPSSSSRWALSKIWGSPKTMLQSLRNTDQPVASYVWRAWLILLLPTIPIGIVGTVLGIRDPDGPSLDELEFFAVGAVLIAPWVETLLMLPILWILKRVMPNTLWVAFGSAVIFGPLHGLNGHGLTAAWMFLVLSLCLLEWEKKSQATAIGVTTLLHMCQNSLVTAVLLLCLVLGDEFPEEKVALPPSRPSPPPQAEERPPRPLTPKFQFGLVESPRPQAFTHEPSKNIAAESPGEKVTAPSLPQRQTEERSARPETPKYQWGLIELRWN